MRSIDVSNSSGLGPTEVSIIELSIEDANNGKPELLAYEEIPSWYQDNPHIRHGYRPVSESTRASFFSWTYLHNETINIYSHLIPAVIFLLGEGFVMWYVHSRYPGATAADYIIFALFILTAVICLGFSACYHTLLNHSCEIEQRWLRLDFVGIILLIIGYSVSGTYMIFWCQPKLRDIHWSVIPSLGAITMVFVLHPKFQGLRWRKFRTMCFVGTGLYGMVPIVHGLALFGWTQMVKQSGLIYYLVGGGLYCVGALVYATRFPESIRPGTFDVFCSSHQIFHVLVVLATVAQLVGVLTAFDYNYHNRAC